jgi:hypothetical protein
MFACLSLWRGVDLPRFGKQGGRFIYFQLFSAQNLLDRSFDCLLDAPQKRFFALFRQISEDACNRGPRPPQLLSWPRYSPAAAT